MPVILGIDIGATGIKAGLVDTEIGTLVTERLRIQTPDPPSVSGITESLSGILSSFDYGGAIGIGFPGVIKSGYSKTALNLSEEWIDFPIVNHFTQAFETRVAIGNDADVALLAEMKFGAGNAISGTVVMVTIGTGLGTAMISDGHLYPNTEFGQMRYRNSIIEHYASNRVREMRKMSWKKWSKHLSSFLSQLEIMLNPELFILGGGVSKYLNEFHKYLDVQVDVVQATFGNAAGVVGAALLADKGDVY